MDSFESLITYALSKEVTDIHFERKRYNNSINIQLRTINGLVVYEHISDALMLMQHLKYLANLDVIENEKPQSGAFTYMFDDKDYYFRLASIFTLHQEVCVLRILNKLHISKRILDPIKYEIESLSKIKSGLVLFSGLTGSGKTTSMYTLLQYFEHYKIYSVEDPIEVHFDHVVQLNINRKVNFGYNEAIVQILRHDPDIICIGEIRDHEAATMAIRAAYTGHLVIATIHAQNTKQTINRLLDLGIHQNDIDANLCYIFSQKLIVENKLRKSVYEVYQNKLL
ncbi:MAG: Flp pilus assembly complex ATPase component TadA [Erysipelothrix sp.]|nr:Flp pilus assembly complex ATPase component TadA [Erysipelothrix sp.]